MAKPEELCKLCRNKLKLCTLWYLYWLCLGKKHNRLYLIKQKDNLLSDKCGKKTYHFRISSITRQIYWIFCAFLLFVSTQFIQWKVTNMVHFYITRHFLIKYLYWMPWHKLCLEKTCLCAFQWKNYTEICCSFFFTNGYKRRFYLPIVKCYFFKFAKLRHFFQKKGNDCTNLRIHILWFFISCLVLLNNQNMQILLMDNEK